MLRFGIAYHVRFMLGLRRLRESMREEELIHGETVFPVSLTLITAFLLLAIGIAAIVSMEFQVGPFGGGGGVRHAAAQGHTVTVKHTPINNPSDVSEPSSAGRT
jgi:hypothetical protein